MSTMSRIGLLFLFVTISVVELLPLPGQDITFHQDAGSAGKLSNALTEVFVRRNRRSPEDNNMMNSGLNTLNQAGSGLANQASGMLGSGMNTLNQAGTGLVNQASGAFNSGLNTLGQAGSGFVNSANGMINSASNMVNSNLPSNGMPPFSATFSPNSGMNFMNSAGNSLNNGFNSGLNQFQGLMATISTQYPGQVTYNPPNWNNFNNGLNNGLPTNMFGMQSTTMAPVTGSNSWNQIKGVVGNAMTDLKNGVVGIGGDIKNTAVNGFNQASQFAQNQYNQLTNGQSTVMPNGNMITAAPTGVPQGSNFFENTWSTVKGWFSG